MALPRGRAPVLSEPGVLARWWAALREALAGAALSLVCGMGLLMHLDEGCRRGVQPEPLPQARIPGQRRGTPWEQVPPQRD